MIPQIVGISAAVFLIFILSWYTYRQIQKSKNPTTMRRKAKRRNEKLKMKMEEMQRIKELDEEYKVLKSKLKCPNCTADIFQPDAVFCPICGKKLS